MKTTAIITDQFKNRWRIDFASKKEAIATMRDEWGWSFLDWELPTFDFIHGPLICEAVLYPAKKAQGLADGLETWSQNS